MNCIHPTAPAELGPMLRPKFDSTLLIAARICQGIPYEDPAACQRAWSCWKSSVRGRAGGVEIGLGTLISPGWFGIVALGRVAGGVASTRNGSALAVEATLTTASASPRTTRFMAIPPGRPGGSAARLLPPEAPRAEASALLPS